MDLTEAYRICVRITRREARNFYYAFLPLPGKQRRAVYALYAFCRAADDVVDSDEPAGSPESITLGSHFSAAQPNGLAGHDEALLERKRAGLARLRERLVKAAAGDPEDGPDLALADAIASFGVDPDDLGDVLAGMKMDLTLSRIETFDELRAYCYYVASAVGLATLPILNDGVPPTDAMRNVAVDLGLGMQLVNILRDVAEDLDRDRVYLPREEMDAFGVEEANLRRRSMNDPLRALLAHQADRAAEYLARGRRLLPHLPRRGRQCPWLLAELYGRILSRIRTAEYDVFRERIALPKREKLALLVASRWSRV